MNRLIITVGIPASGKSTWVKSFLSSRKDFVCISRDGYRYMLRNEGWTELNIESMINEMVDEAIIKAFKNKLNVIIDATNLKISYIKHFIELTKEYVEKVEYVIFDNTNLEECIKRDFNRERKVGAEVMFKMYNSWNELVKTDFYKNTILENDIHKELKERMKG